MMLKKWFAGVVVFATAVAGAPFAGIAHAQVESGIAGVARDTTGLPLPGVAVEASSPALLEKVRSAVTDGQGLYNITGLRPGVYSVVFTLPGFTTVRREGVELTSTFTATVNVELRVGGIEEAVTVSGASPTVDIQNTVQQKSFTREVIEVLPTGSKSWAALAVLVPGAKLSGAQNVGGTGSSNATVSIHGGLGAEAIMLLDGMRYNQGNGFGGVRNAYNENDGSVEEITFQTGALTAEIETGSFVRNIVPRDGGNRFTFFFGTAFTNKAFQADNLDEDLAARGITSGNFVDRIYDVNPAAGGPVVQNKLWFYSAFRRWGVDQGIAGTFFNKNPSGLSYDPDLSRPALSTSEKGSQNLRLTWMATPKNKISGFYEVQQNIEQWNYGQGALGTGGVTSPEAQPYYEVEPHYFIQSRWTNPLTSRVLLEAGTTYVKSNFQTRPQDDNPLEVPAIREIRTNTVWRNRMGTYGQNPAHNLNSFASMSYVTGSHTFKAGALFINMAAHTTRESTGNGTALQLLDGVPSSVVVYATPLALDEKLRMQLGFFAQDNWKIKRATIYAGLRYDNYNAYVPEQTIGPGPWTPDRHATFDEVPNVPNWKDFSPRFGVNYDLFGTGRTAIKGTLNRYLFGPDLIVFTRLANPVGAITTSATRTWADLNNDFIPQERELGALSARDFGSPTITTRYDSDVLEGWGKRGNNWEGSVGIQHELMARVGVSAAYFRRWWGNMHVTRNRAVSAGDFDSYCITAPTDARLPGGGGNEICGLYDVSPEKFGLTDNLITFSDNYGKQTQVYDGVDLNMNARFGNGAIVAGGTNTERTRTDACYAMSDPSLSAIALDTPRTEQYCNVRPPFQTQYKFYGSYPLPWYGLSASATLQSQPGPMITASYTARNSEIAPSLGRNLSSGANGTATVQLIPNGTLYGDRLNQVDFRLAKTFTVAQGRLQAVFDLYNLFNDNPVISMNNTYGSAWQRPTVIQVGRLAKFGFQYTF
jgi:Carboxypeptidase regulatory-like domain